MSRSVPRLYTPFSENPLQPGGDVVLQPGQAHYLRSVMRCATGAPVRVFNGRDGEWRAVIESLRKDQAVLRLQERERAQKATDGVELLFAPLRRDMTELVVRMGTELGVTRFRPIVTSRTNTHRINQERLTLIAREAAEQCERLDVPEILPLDPLPAVLARWPADRILRVALERSAPHEGEAGGDALLIGPEGGFSEEEVTMFKRHPAIRMLSLGRLILRAETAACSGLTRLMTARG